MYEKWACITNPFKGVFGKKKFFNRNDMYILRSLIKDKVNWYLDELTHEMENLTGKRASISTLWRSLRYLGITRKKLQKEVYERSEIIRAHYLGVIGESYISNQLIFIDESAKNERSLSRFYGFIDFILDQVVPIMNPYPGSNSVIVMDNAKIHYDANLISILEGLGCHVIFLLPYSLDYNPIETAFSLRVVKSLLKWRNLFLNHQSICKNILLKIINKIKYITIGIVQMGYRLVAVGSRYACNKFYVNLKERKDNNDYYHTLVEGRKRMFWEDVVMKVNLKYKSRFIGSQVKEKFQGIIRDCRLMKILFLEKKESKYDIKHRKNVERRREIVTLSEERNLEEEDEDHI
ncbi:homeodomain-like protein [Rhizophagus clarus]|uniref:Homeodomain-like protein n=1 Tax=Rhizophagus clarus TaxID=94130 RepID=A0A8H3LLL7_9GLOM|nr:homeodomain-like protein [Rhizophagus clarus]